MRLITALCLAALLAPAAVDAAPKPAPVPAVVAERDRTSPGGRAVHVILPQTHIETSIDVGRVAADYSGGLLDTLIIRSMDDKKEVLSRNQNERTLAAAQPLFSALEGFDVDALALAATRNGLASTAWFQPRPFTLTRDASPAVAAAFVAGADTPQLATISYRYDLSPDFTQIRVTADLALAYRPAAKGDKVPTVAPPFYRQRITSIVELRTRAYDPNANVALWSAEGGRLAKTSLAAAFAATEELIPYALGLGAADIKAFEAKDREKGFAAGLYGPLVARRHRVADDTLIWSGGLVYVQPAP
ncbi:hypothetical protein [Sphingopyxis sp. KK2]|uniref:hypothetical protein n=1 Tax=Sphingopyxis sp. KK2 TaxID=1855727 RepID=UPI00097E5A53|nr:hypothetical protein [Sphingopyxis sp. KK2]